MSNDIDYGPQFTPAPWTVNWGPLDAEGQAVILGPGAEPIAFVADWNPDAHSGMPDLANAPLLAAAPDLYAALEAIVATLNGVEQVRELITTEKVTRRIAADALKKATDTE